MKTNFYIMGIVAINQIFSFKSSSGGFNVQLNEDEYREVEKKAKDYGDCFSLYCISKFREKNETTQKTIKDCYDANKDEYKNAIETFNNQITETENILNGYPPQLKAAHKQLSNIADLLKGYPHSLSIHLKSLRKATTKMARKSFAIKKFLTPLYAALWDLQKKGRESDTQCRLNQIVDQMEADCENVILQIKTCMGETEPFVPLKHIDDSINI